MTGFLSCAEGLADGNFPDGGQAEGALMKASLQDLQCFRAQSSITVWVQVPVYPEGPSTWRSILEDVF